MRQQNAPGTAPGSAVIQTMFVGQAAEWQGMKVGKAAPVVARFAAPVAGIAAPQRRRKVWHMRVRRKAVRNASAPRRNVAQWLVPPKGANVHSSRIT